jgi:hypothetical protein
MRLWGSVDLVGWNSRTNLPWKVPNNGHETSKGSPEVFRNVLPQIGPENALTFRRIHLDRPLPLLLPVIMSSEVSMPRDYRREAGS